jgi:hypothetical protein
VKGLQRTLHVVLRARDGSSVRWERLQRTLRSLLRTLRVVLRRLHGFILSLRGFIRTLHARAAYAAGVCCVFERPSDELRAGENGVVWPRNEGERQMLESKKP